VKEKTQHQDNGSIKFTHASWFPSTLEIQNMIDILSFNVTGFSRCN